jgi:radical SAM protein with 4Fe4S-binding SPASM domain
MDPCDYKPIPKTSYEEFMKEKYWAKNRPMSIHFELTQRCNLRCIHCLFTHETADELSTEEILRILMQLKEIGVFSLSLSGGEIFARKDIEAILDFLMIQRFMVIIYTNGTLLNQCIIKKIAALNPFSVEISVYGATPEVHDAITGVTGSFEKTVDSIRELTRKHVPSLFKGFLLRDNFDQRRQMIELANRLGVPYSFDFNLIPMETGNINNLSDGLSIAQLKKIYQEVHAEGLILRNNVMITERESQLPKGGSVICNPGRINGCIASNGDVFPCPILRIPMGNLREKSLEEIWKTDNIDSLRYMTVADLKECSVCPALEFCNRCPGVAYLETGDFLGPSPFAVCSKYKTLSQCTERG